MQGNPVRTLWISGLLSLLSIAVYGWISVAPAADLTPASTSDHDSASASLAEYVFLHQTRNESNPLKVGATADVCRGLILDAGS